MRTVYSYIIIILSLISTISYSQQNAYHHFNHDTRFGDSVSVIKYSTNQLSEMLHLGDCKLKAKTKKRKHWPEYDNDKPIIRKTSWVECKKFGIWCWKDPNQDSLKLTSLKLEYTEHVNRHIIVNRLDTLILGKTKLKNIRDSLLREGNYSEEDYLYYFKKKIFSNGYLIKYIGDYLDLVFINKGTAIKPDWILYSVN